MMLNIDLHNTAIKNVINAEKYITKGSDFHKYKGQKSTERLITLMRQDVLRLHSVF